MNNSQYRYLPTTVRPMPLLCPSEQFIAEWKRCWEDPKTDLGDLLSIAQPFLANWEAMLTRAEYSKDINYLTLCRLISPESIDQALEMTRLWVVWAQQSSSVFEELQLLFIERVRTIGYFPTFAKPVMCEYVIARDFKLSLRHLIIGSINEVFENVDLDYLLEDTTNFVSEYEHPDYFLLQNIDFTDWDNYLFRLLGEGRSCLEISQLLHIPRETFINEERRVWRLLEKMQSDS